MSVYPDSVSYSRRRLHFGLVAILTSATIAILIATGAAKPYPNIKFAYLICVAVGVVGLIQLVIAITGRSPNKSLERMREG